MEHNVKTVNVVLTQIFGRFVGYVCLEISTCYSESILMKVSDIIMHIMQIIWWGLQRILWSRTVLEVYRKALKIKI